MFCMDGLIQAIDHELRPNLRIESLDPHNPVHVSDIPVPWHLVGCGNYAAVVSHADYPEWVVKVYAPGRCGLEEEVEVYRRLGHHPAFSECLYAGDCFLVLKRLRGVTLYDAFHLGLPIPEQVIQDIDHALDYARQRGLHPHDVHGRNVMMHGNRGLVVDVSDFLHEETCSAWTDLKFGYYWVYRPFLSRWRSPIPYFLLDRVRWCYRVYRRLTGQRLKSSLNIHR